MGSFWPSLLTLGVNHTPILIKGWGFFWRGHPGALPPTTEPAKQLQMFEAKLPGIAQTNTHCHFVRSGIRGFRSVLGHAVALRFVVVLGEENVAPQWVETQTSWQRMAATSCNYIFTRPQLGLKVIYCNWGRSKSWFPRQGFSTSAKCRGGSLSSHHHPHKDSQWNSQPQCGAPELSNPPKTEQWIITIFSRILLFHLFWRDYFDISTINPNSLWSSKPTQRFRTGVPPGAFAFGFRVSQVRAIVWYQAFWVGHIWCEMCFFYFGISHAVVRCITMGPTCRIKTPSWKRILGDFDPGSVNQRNPEMWTIKSNPFKGCTSKFTPQTGTRWFRF